MSDNRNLRNEDRLPWLETVEPDEPEGVPARRLMTLGLMVLVVLAVLALGVWKLEQRPQAADGQLIAAPEGPYKVRPDDPGGLKVQGEGNSAIATSAGKGTGNGAIDLNQVPEAPVAGKRASGATGHAAAGANAVAQVPASGGKLIAAAPIASRHPSPASSVPGGSLVQLGAYPSEAVANAAWDRFSKRFAYLAPFGKAVQPVATGGRTLYRLRVNAGSADQAADLCGKLRVAGESCFVAS